jgi:hypothetical protein
MPRCGSVNCGGTAAAAQPIKIVEGSATAPTVAAVVAMKCRRFIGVLHRNS